MDGLLNLIAAIKDPDVFQKRIEDIMAAKKAHDDAAEDAAKAQAAANEVHQKLEIRERALEERAIAVNRQAEANSKRLAELDLSNQQLRADIQHHALDHARHGKVLDDREAAVRMREAAAGAKESELEKREKKISPREQAADKKAAAAQIIIERAMRLADPAA